MGRKKIMKRKPPAEGDVVLVPGQLCGSPWLTNSQAYKRYLNEHFEKLQELKDIASGMNLYQPTMRNYK